MQTADAALPRMSARRGMPGAHPGNGGGAPGAFRQATGSVVRSRRRWSCLHAGARSWSAGRIEGCWAGCGSFRAARSRMANHRPRPPRAIAALAPHAELVR